MDETRVELCREILSELFGTECALVAWVSGYADSTEAVYVWDFMSRKTPARRIWSRQSPASSGSSSTEKTCLR